MKSLIPLSFPLTYSLPVSYQTKSLYFENVKYHDVCVMAYLNTWWWSYCFYIKLLRVTTTGSWTAVQSRYYSISMDYYSVPSPPKTKSKCISVPQDTLLAFGVNSWIMIPLSDYPKTTARMALAHLTALAIKTPGLHELLPYPLVLQELGIRSYMVNNWYIATLWINILTRICTT